MSFKLHLILARKPSVFMQIRCNFPDISYLSETQKNTFQFLKVFIILCTRPDVPIINEHTKNIFITYTYTLYFQLIIKF